MSVQLKTTTHRAGAVAGAGIETSKKSNTVATVAKRNMSVPRGPVRKVVVSKAVPKSKAVDGVRKSASAPEMRKAPAKKPAAPAAKDDAHIKLMKSADKEIADINALLEKFDLAKKERDAKDKKAAEEAAASKETTAAQKEEPKPKASTDAANALKAIEDTVMYLG